MLYKIVFSLKNILRLLRRSEMSELLIILDHVINNKHASDLI